MRQVHPQNTVAGLKHGGIGGLIGLRSGMWLNVGMLGAEQLFRPIASEIFHHVNEFASTVIALTRITFRVFIREHAAGGLQDRFGSEVFAGDQFQAAILALDFVLYGFVNVGIDDRERARHSLWVGH